MALPGGHGHDGGGKLLRTVHLGAKDDGEVAPVIAEGIDVSGGAEQVFHVGHGRQPFAEMDLKARIWSAMARSAGRRSALDAP